MLPIVSATNLPMQPMVAPNGYSLNANTTVVTAEAAMAFVRHMTAEDTQRRLVERLRMLPVRTSVQDDPLFSTDPTLAVSRRQLEHGRLMPVVTELRAVWDGMRPAYQAVLGGSL